MLTVWNLLSSGGSDHRPKNTMQQASLLARSHRWQRPPSHLLSKGTLTNREPAYRANVRTVLVRGPTQRCGGEWACGA
jgi:hypothetical protein